MLYFASLGKTHQDTNTIHCRMSDIRENLVDFFTLLFLGLTVQPCHYQISKCLLSNETKHVITKSLKNITFTGQ